jgi:hypothetical protein
LEAQKPKRQSDKLRLPSLRQGKLDKSRHKRIMSADPVKLRQAGKIKRQTIEGGMVGPIPPKIRNAQSL